MTIYLAGPDVFAPNAIQLLKEKAEEVSKKVTGSKVLTPFDLEPPLLDSKKEIGYKIRHNNLKMIASCDVILANLNPFRGDEPDSGTVYEVAYGTALGKKVVGYMENFDKTQRERLGHKDANGWDVEDFDLALNLMLYGDAFTLTHSFESAIEKIM